MRGGPGAEGFGGFAEAFGDIFGDMFGGQRGAGGRGGRQMYRGNDLSYAMEITLEEAAKGKSTEIRIPSWDTCDTCHGSGAKPGTQPKTCRHLRRQWLGADAPRLFSVQQTCPHCQGTGKIIPEPCTSCHGQGKIKKQKTLEVKSRRYRQRHAHSQQPAMASRAVNWRPGGRSCTLRFASSSTRFSSAMATTCTARCR